MVVVVVVVAAAAAAAAPPAAVAVAPEALQPGSAPWKCWQAIPEWMRCSMVVISTGPGGNGVAFHKHGTAWLVLQQGVKRWWLYYYCYVCYYYYYYYYYHYYHY